jgi:hypothetical protein
MKKNMSWYWLLCDSVVADHNWVLRDASGRVRLRERYEKFQCPSCKKVDELAALRSGIDADVQMRARFDMFATCEDMICVNQKVVSLFKTHKLTGVRFIPLPGDAYFLMYPTRLLEVTDISSSGMRLFKPCKLCKRPRELKCFPACGSLTLPTRSSQIGMLWPALETITGRSFFFVVSERVREIIQKEAVRGSRLMFAELT